MELVSKKYYYDIDLNGNSLLNFAVESASGELPSEAKEGAVIYHTGEGVIYQRLKDGWKIIASKEELDDALSKISEDIQALSKDTGETLDSKADKATVASLRTEFDEEVRVRAEEDTNIKADLDTKADKTTVSSLSYTLTEEVQARVAGDNTNATTISTHATNKSNPHEVTKEQVGLGNVDDTSDIDKPISTATQNALDTKADKTAMETALGTKQDALVAGSHISIASDGKTISSTYDVASTTANGLMSKDDKSKLGGISAGAQVNVIETVKVNNTALGVSGKAVNIDLSDYATKTDVNNAISSAIEWKGTVEKESELSTINASKGDMYHVNEKSAEYVYNGTEWEELGSIVDLSDYVTTSAMTAALGGKQDTLTAGANITISGKTISAKDTTYSVATTNANGLMSSGDKSKLDGISAGAQVNSITGVKGNSESTYRTGNVNITPANIGLGNVNNTSDVNKPISTATQNALDGKQATIKAGTNITIASDGVTISAKDTTYGVATTSANGLLSSTDKKKLDGISEGANKITVDSSLNNTSTNPVQNKVIHSALNGKLSTSGTAAKATADADGNNIVDTYETKANAIIKLEASGRTITYTKGDNTTGTITTQDKNTDTKVKQTNSTANTAYPILLKNGTGTGEVTNNVLFDDGVTVNPSTGIITAPGFAGPLTGNVTGNCSGSSGSCTGNAATATQFSANKSVTLSGDVTGSASGKAGWTVTTTLADSGVTAGNYGPSANASPAHKGTFSVPYITVDAKGRVTAASTKTITLPADNNTDTKNTTGTTNKTGTKLFIVGATSQGDNPQTYSNANVYIGTDNKLYSNGKVVIASGDTATAATKATQDGSGNNIVNTYATKTELNGKANSSHTHTEYLPLTGGKVTGPTSFTGQVGNTQSEAGVYLGLDANGDQPNANMAIVSANTAAYIDMGALNEDYGFRIIKWIGMNDNLAQLCYPGATITIPWANGTMALTSQIPVITASKTDIGEGSSLATGTLYLVYE